MRCAHLVVAIVGATSVCQGIQSPCSVERSPGLTSPQPPPTWKLQSGVLSEEKPGLVVGIFLGTLVPQQGFVFFFPARIPVGDGEHQNVSCLTPTPHRSVKVFFGLDP